MHSSLASLILLLLQVYVSKNGQELTGRDAYKQYKKVKCFSILKNNKDTSTFSWFILCSYIRFGKKNLCSYMKTIYPPFCLIIALGNELLCNLNTVTVGIVYSIASAW